MFFPILDVSETVTVLLDVSDRADSCVIVFAGRTVLEQNDRNGGPTLGQNVTISSGEFVARSGPGTCPTIGRNNVILAIHSVPLAIAVAAGICDNGIYAPVMTGEWAAAAGRRHQGAEVGRDAASS